MRTRVTLKPVALPRRTPDGGVCYETKARGLDVLNSPQLNKGTAFTAEERKGLGLTGLIPPEISTLAAQVKGAYVQYERLPDALSKNIYLTALHDRNEVLFYRLFSEHLREMIPIVNDLTVGLAVVHYRHECRRPRGVYLSIDHPGSMEEAFTNFEAGADDIDLILATDAEQISGIGDWGVGGIEVTIGKLAIYTAAGGVDPKRVIPVMLDVGTNRESLLTDPMYIGNRHARVRGTRYDEFIDEYVRTVGRLFPKALLQWEDLAPGNGRRILGKYRDRLCMFNDDMQGTGVVALAAAISAARASGTSLRKQRVVIFGAGTAGMGAADQLAAEMRREGLSEEEALGRFWCVDQQGLLTASMEHQLQDFQRPYARPNAESSRWRRDEGGRGVGLAEVVRRVKPTMLIGASGAAGAFTESIVREMAANEERPIVFVLSSPSARAEAGPSDLVAWTEGRGLLATGSPSPPVTYKGVTYVVAHADHTLLYPGVGLGTIVSQASRVSEGMLLAAASAVSSLVTVRQPGASLLPQIDDLRSVSLTVAVAVAEAAVVEGLAGVKCKDIEREMHEAMWQPEYRRVVGV